MKTTVNIKRSVQDFTVNRVRATVSLLVENSYKEEKDWLTTKPFSFKIRYGFIVRDQFQILAEKYTKDQMKYSAKRVKV